MSVKVAFVGGLNRDQSIWSMCRGFEGIGCTVDYIPLEHIKDNVKCARPDAKDRVIATCENADVLLWWQPKQWTDIDFILDLRKKSPDTRFVSWSIDDPHVLDAFDPDSLKSFEFGATCCKGSFGWYEKNGVKPFHLLTPCDAERHGKAVPDPNQVCDIGFASSNTYRHEKWPYVYASRVQMVIVVWDLGKVHVYGDWINREGSWGHPNYGLPDKYRPGSRGKKSALEMSTIYPACRINLGSTVRPDGYQYINRRIVECMGSGGFMLSDRVNGIEEVLVEDKEIVLWSNLDELRSKTKWYLEHEDERQAIAKAGQKKALELWEGKVAATRVLQEVGLG